MDEELLDRLMDIAIGPGGERLIAETRAAADGIPVPTCHSREGGNLKIPSHALPDEPEALDIQGQVAGGSRDSRLRGNDTEGGGVGVSPAADEEDLVPPHTTPHGTLCAKSWTADWIERVEAKEQSLDRPICGARLMSGNPCTLVSTHASGRCRYHGGFDLTGAPEGNRNAVLHNLYSRRLMPCGKHCPAWQSCPLGGGAKDGGASIVKLDQADRPICPYEQTEYNVVVSDGLRRVSAKYALGYARHVIHQLALAQVMVTRAGLALREAEFVKVTVITGEKYHMTTPKIAPALTAYERLERSWRRLLNDFERIYATEYPPHDHHQQFTTRVQTDTPLDPDTQAQHYESMLPSTDSGAGFQPAMGPNGFQPAADDEDRVPPNTGTSLTQDNPVPPPNSFGGASTHPTPTHEPVLPKRTQRNAEKDKPIGPQMNGDEHGWNRSLQVNDNPAPTRHCEGGGADRGNLIHPRLRVQPIPPANSEWEVERPREPGQTSDPSGTSLTQDNPVPPPNSFGGASSDQTTLHYRVTETTDTAAKTPARPW